MRGACGRPRDPVPQPALTERVTPPSLTRPMRGRRRTAAAALAETLARRPEARAAALVAAFSEACGARMASEASLRGPIADGRLLVVVRTPAWAEQLAALEREV